MEKEKDVRSKFVGKTEIFAEGQGQTEGSPGWVFACRCGKEFRR